MPGRGANWRGVGQGNQDRIGSGEVENESLLSEDIKDGTIQEADLDSALQTKINSGGGGTGNTEIVLDALVPSNLTSHSFNLSRNVDMDGSDVAQLIVLVQNIKMSADQRLLIMFNGQGFNGNGKTEGLSSDGVTVSAFQDTGDINSIIEIASTGEGYVKLEIEGDTNGSVGQGFIKSSNESSGYGSGGVTLRTNAFDPITSVQLRSEDGIVTINTLTRVVVLAINKD